MDNITLLSMLARNIRGLRIEKQMNQREVVDALGNIFSDKALSCYESGKREIPVIILYRLAELYGVTIDELFHEIPRIAWADNVWGVKPK